MRASHEPRAVQPTAGGGAAALGGGAPWVAIAHSPHPPFSEQSYFPAELNGTTYTGVNLRVLDPRPPTLAPTSVAGSGYSRAAGQPHDFSAGALLGLNQHPWGHDHGHPVPAAHSHRDPAKSVDLPTVSSGRHGRHDIREAAARLALGARPPPAAEALGPRAPARDHPTAPVREYPTYARVAIGHQEAHSQREGASDAHDPPGAFADPWRSDPWPTWAPASADALASHGVSHGLVGGGVGGDDARGISDGAARIRALTQAAMRSRQQHAAQGAAAAQGGRPGFAEVAEQAAARALDSQMASMQQADRVCTRRLSAAPVPTRLIIA